MKSLRLSVLVAAGLASLLPAAAPPRTDRRVLPGDAHDLVLLHPSRPYRVRLHVQPGGRSVLDRWRAQVAVLFAHLDINGDGKLDRAEARAAPSRVQWAQMLLGERQIEPDAAPDFAELLAGAEEVRVGQLAAYYDGSVAGPVHVRWAPGGGRADPVSAALWKRLDADRDGTLSRAELRAARPGRAGPRRRRAGQRRRVARRLRPDGHPRPRHRRAGPRGGARGAALGFPPSGRAGRPPGRGTAGGLRPRPRRPTDRELGLGAAAFRRLDLDGDGRLDRAELAAWAAWPPDVSVIVPLGGSARAAVEALPGSAPGVVVRPERAGVGLIFGDHAVSVCRAGGQHGPPAADEGSAVFRKLDRNGDGYLETKEVQRPPFSHVAWLRLADRDGDGRISRKEFDAFAALLRRLRSAATFLRVGSGGRSLFRLLDADGDGSLSPREMRYAWERASPWADRKTGAVRAGQVPRQFRVTLWYGSGPPAGPMPRGPLWFRKMDRNGDGDVSLKEWLGSRETFERIDADGDGLIGPEEAERADRKARGSR